MRSLSKSFGYMVSVSDLTSYPLDPSAFHLRPVHLPFVGPHSNNACRGLDALHLVLRHGSSGPSCDQERDGEGQPYQVKA